MVLIWGSNWSIMKMGLDRSPPFIFVSHRLLFSLVFLLWLNTTHRPRLSRDWTALKRISLYSLFSTFSFASSSLGLKSQGSGVGAVLTYTQPIMVFMLMVAFLGETFSMIKFMGTLLGFSGVAVLFLENIGSHLSWDLLLFLLGAFLWAVGTVYFKVKLQSQDAAFVNMIQATIASIMMYGVSFFTEPLFQAWSWSYVAILVYAGIGASGIGMTIWLTLLKDEDPTSLSSSSLIVPCIALLFGWILMSEELTALSLAGSALTIFGIFLVNHTGSQRSSTDSR